jgi:beta-1,4-mannosyl-glycoprotein beta-1,4-N-acetylglucosaminyltransferase
MLFNEMDLLEIRLGELYDTVDAFVLAEGTETFSGNRKPFHYVQNLERFKPWSDKVHFVPLFASNWPVPQNDAWAREKHTRQVLADYVRVHFNRDDTVCFSDLDEIPKPDVLKELTDGRYYALNGTLSYYWFNCRSTSWTEDYCRVGSVGRLAQVGGEAFRRGQPDISVAEGCWHFSCLGGPSAVADKLRSFAHTEYSGNYWTDLERLEHVIQNGLDVVERPYMQFKFVPLDETYPKYLLANIEKFKHLIREIE